MQYFISHKTEIVDFLTNFLKKKQQELKDSYFSRDIFKRLIPLATGGKMLRGSLLINTYERLSDQKFSPKVLDKSVKEYEPHLALDGGSDGLKYIKEIVKQAKKRLNHKGIILLEVDYTHDEEFLRQNLKLKDFQLQVTRDQFQRTRFAVLSKN